MCDEVSVEGTLEGLLCYALGIFSFSEARTLGSCTRLRYIDERIALMREADGLEKLRLIVGLCSGSMRLGLGRGDLFSLVVLGFSLLSGSPNGNKAG